MKSYNGCIEDENQGKIFVPAKLFYWFNRLQRILLEFAWLQCLQLLSHFEFLIPGNDCTAGFDLCYNICSVFGEIIWQVKHQCHL